MSLSAFSRWHTIILILLIIPAAIAANIADYPYIFVKDGKFKATYVIGEDTNSKDVVSATVLSTALAKYPNITTEIGTSRIDGEIGDITQYNAIVIGSPCELNSAAKLQGEPEPCYKFLSPGSGHIRLYENNGKYQLLITGLSPEDRYQAAKFLANQPLKDLTARTHVIATGTNSSYQYFAQYNNSDNSVAVNNSNQNSQSNSVITTGNNLNTANHSAPIVEKKVQQTETWLMPQNEGHYEPLDEMPKRKGFFGRMWTWLKGLFR